MTDVEQIEAVLRSDVAEPSPAFAAELDRRVSEGFPKPARRPRPWLRPALAAGAVVLAAAIAVVALRLHQEHKVSEAFNGRATDANLLAAGPRRVERDVRLTIAASGDKLQQTADAIGTTAEAHHGFVASSHVTTGDTGTSGGSFELRVPQRELESTIADLSQLGQLRSRSENAQDLTAPFGRTQDRLGNALVERRTLKLRSQAPAVRARIAELNATIDRLGARLRNLRGRTSYSTVSVTLEQAKKKHAGGTGAAFDDARRILEGIVNFAVRALAVLLPLGIFAALAALAARVLRRRLASRALR
jgi:Domain of unknown function (DUF4349)